MRENFLLLVVFLVLSWPITISGLNSGLNSCASPPPSVEVLALQEFYNSTGGMQWINKWTSLSNPCVGTYGVTCYTVSKSCHVALLSMPSNNLVGTLPSSLGSLSQLRSLRLSNNSIAGDLPMSTWTLMNLAILDVSSNRMGGNISSSIGGLIQLTELSLSANRFSGSLPKSLGNLTHLVALDLSRNRLIDIIPSSLGNLSSLIKLDLSDNRFTGTIPSFFGGLLRLTTLRLSGNGLMGTIPSSLLSLAILTELDISRNRLSGSISPDIVGLHSLVSLKLQSNQLTGTLPSYLSNLTKLEELDLSSNLFVGSIPSAIGFLSELKQLALDNNHLVGMIPHAMDMLLKLTYLNLNYNFLEGSLPKEVIGLPHLMTLIVANNQFTGTIPSTIDNLSKLVTLRLEVNCLRGSIPSTIGNMTMLEILDLSWNNLTGNVPMSIGNLSHLQWMSLGSNILTGSIPATLYQLSELHGLYLYDNHLTGSISSSIAHMTKLNDAHLNENQLTGTLPPSISELKRLLYLVVYGNLLTGTVPPSILEMSLLVELHLESNQLSGTIPSTIGKSPSFLAGLFLESNELTGSIPASIGNLLFLEVLQLFENDLTGTIPSSIGSLPALLELLLYSNKLSGTIPMLTTMETRNNNSLTVTSAISSETSNRTAYRCQNNALHSCFLSYNFLTGPLPSCFDALYSLVYLGLENTFLSINGSQMFPTNLEYLDLSGVGLNDSQVVEEILQQKYAYVDLSQNAFGGSIPASVWNASIQRLLLDNNQFSGSFPAPNGRLCTMNYISISANRLTGTLPLELNVCENLTAFFAANMSLTGPVKGRFADQRQLQTVAIANNAFTGPVDDIFKESTASNWVLNAGYNELTGTLPADRLSTGKFQSLILLVNCISGTLPAEALCKNTNMSELLLSGLHTAEACRSLFLPSWSGGWTYIESNSVRGSIPPCLLSPALPQLTYLALSGNLFTGTIANDVVVSSTTIGVDLSHNAMTGTIPPSLLEAKLDFLDLSFNRFSGTIADSATIYYATAVQAQVSLEVNMLSGTLPANWIEANNINVLNGNMFACSSHQLFHTMNEPVNDPLARNYACGSSLTNLSLLVFLVAKVAVALIVLFSVRSIKNGRHFLDRAQTELTRLLLTCQSLVGVNRWRNALGMCAFLTVSLLVCAVMNVVTSAYGEKYLWIVSISLQQGTVVGSMLLVWLFAVCMWVHYRAEADAAFVGQYSFSIRRFSRQLASRHGKTVTVTWLTAWAVFLALVGTHVIPVFAVNMVYVYTTTLSLSLWLRSTIVMCMSMFKLSWNTLICEWFSNRYLPVHMSTTLADEVFVDAMLLYANVISLIVVPAVTEMLMSPNCFHYLFTAISTDSYVVQGSTCYWISYTENKLADRVAVACMPYAELEATYNSGSEATGTGNYNMMILSTSSNDETTTVAFTAGFAYNFQCTLSLLESFVFVFVYKYVCRLVLLPLLWTVLKQAQTFCFNQYGPSSYWFRLVTRCSPLLMRLIDDEAVDLGAKHYREEVIAYNTTLLHRWHREKQCERVAKRLKMRVISDLAIILSFGLMFPLLGIVALMEMVMDLLMTHRMLDRVRRYGERIRSVPVAAKRVEKVVETFDDKTRQSEEVDVETKDATVDDQLPTMSNDEYADLVLRLVDDMDAACTNHLQDIQQLQPMLLYFAALVWSLGLYDIVGRQTGPVFALWIFFVTLTMPGWTSLLGFLCFRKSKPFMKRQDTPSVDVDIEMTTENPICAGKPTVSQEQSA